MNCTTPTRRPWPSMRSARPKAAVHLPLPGPVWTMSRPFSMVFAGDLGVLHRLALRHLRLVALGGVVVVSVISLHPQRQAGDRQHDRVGEGGDALVEPAGGVAEAAGERRSPGRCRGRPRSRPAPGAARAGERRGEAVGLGRRGRGRRASGSLSQSVRQSTSAGRPGGQRRRAPRRARAAPRAVSQPAARRARCSAMRAAISASRACGGGEVEPGAGAGGDQRLGVRALAGAGAAEDEGQPPSGKPRLRRRRARRRSAAGQR